MNWGTVRRLAAGGTGTAAAVLLPRVWSVATQWLVAFAAGTAALTDYLTTTTRGAAAVSLVANALAPVVLLRRAAMRSPSGRALIGGALLIMAFVAFALTLGFEVVFGLGPVFGLYTAAFAATTLLSSPTPAIWPHWQVAGRYFHIVVPTVLVLGCSIVAAVLKNPRLAATIVGLGGAIPTIALFGRFRLRRALRYSLALAWRAVPVSSMSFATALVYPLSISRGTELFGGAAVGQQLLFWPFVIALGISSQSIAARALSESRHALDDAFKKWARAGYAFMAVAGLAFAVFQWRQPAASGPLPLGLLVSGCAFIRSDPICLYFAPQTNWRLLAIGSVASALLVGTAVILWPSFVLTHFSVCGPSAIVATMRLLFVQAPPLRRHARTSFVVLAAGFAVAAWVG